MISERTRARLAGSRVLGSARWWWLVAAGVVAVAAFLVAEVLGTRPEPISISYGSSGNTAELYPGLHPGRGIRPVNDFGPFHEDIYIPPQNGTFSLFADIANNGTGPVTVESVSMPAGSPVTLAAPVRYSTPGMGGSNQIPPPMSRVLHDVVLGPGQEMFVGFPVRMWPCAQKDGWTEISFFLVRVRNAQVTRTVAVPWGNLGDALIVHAPGGRPGQPGTVCAPHAVLPSQPADGQPEAIAGTILRVNAGRDTAELRITQMTAPDAARLNPPLPRCMLEHGASQRVVNFDLNWAAINFGQSGTAPAARLTITGPHGEPVLAVVPTGPNTQACRPVRAFPLPSQRPGWQLVYGLIMRLPAADRVRELNLQIDGHPIAVDLEPVCPQSTCFQDNPPVPWTPGTPYSVQMTI